MPAVRIVNRAAEQGELAAIAVDGTFGTQAGGFQGGRERNDFEHRTWLERDAEGVVHPRLGVLSTLHRYIGIESGIARHRQDVAGVRLHHHDAARVGIVRSHGGSDFALGHKLQPLIDGQRERGAGLGGNRSLRRDAAAVNVGQQAGAAGRAAEFLVEPLLDTGIALLFEIDGAQNVCRERAVRIVTLAFNGQAHPIDARFQVEQVVVLFGSEFALDGEEAAVRIGGLFDLQVEVGAVHVQKVAEKIGRHADVHLHGIDEDGARRQAHGQRPPVAVEDRAARRGYIDHHFLDGAGRGRVLPVMDHLQRDEVLENCPAPQQDYDGETCKTALDHDAQREEIHASSLLTSPLQPHPGACLPGGRPGPRTELPDCSRAPVDPIARG